MLDVRAERSASYLPSDLYGVPAYSSFLRSRTRADDLCERVKIDRRKLNGDDLGGVIASPAASSELYCSAGRSSDPHSSKASRSSSSSRITEPAWLEGARHSRISGLKDTCHATDAHPDIGVARSGKFVERVCTPLCVHGFNGRDIGRGVRIHSASSRLSNNLCSGYLRGMHTVGTKDSYSWLTACALCRSSGSTGERCSSSTGIDSRCSSDSLHGIGFSGLSRCGSVEKNSYDVAPPKTCHPKSSEFEVALAMRPHLCMHRSESMGLGICGEDRNTTPNKDCSLDQSHSLCSHASSSPSWIQSEDSAELASAASVSYYDPRLWCKSELGGSGYGQLADNGPPCTTDTSSACSSPATFSNPRYFTAVKHQEQTPHICTSESDLSGLVTKLEEVFDSARVATDDATLQLTQQTEQPVVGFLPACWGDSIVEEDANISWDELRGVLHERDGVVGDLVIGTGLEDSFLSP